MANLLLARAAARESEMAVRSALGAARGRLVRQLLTESVILSIVGGGLGLLLAVWGVDVLVGLQPTGIPRLDDVRVDGTVIVYTFGLAVVTGLIFGLVPAFQSTASGLAGTLKESGRGAVTNRGGARMRSVLVVAEMALAVVLLAGAGLLIRSFTKLASVDPGFHAEQALTFELSLPDSRYEEEARQIAFFDQLLPRLRSIPGVQSAAAVLSLPLSGSSVVLSFEIAGRPPVPPSQQPAIQTRVATPDYFRTIGIPLKRGRYFTEDDKPGAPKVVVITESAARQYFPNEDPIGKTITLGWGRGPGKPRAGGEVVGIVGDVKDAGLDEADPPQLYMPYRQWPVQGMSVVLKTAVPPGLGRRGGAPRGVRRRSEHARRERADAGANRRPVDLAAAVLHDAAGDLCRGGADPGGHRHLRRAVVRRVAADPRDRHPHGARRAGTHRPSSRRARSYAARCRGGRHRHGVRVFPVAIAGRLAAVQHEPAGSADVRRGGRVADPRRIRLELHSGAPRHAGRSNDRAPGRLGPRIHGRGLTAADSHGLTRHPNHRRPVRSVSRARRRCSTVGTSG